MRPRIGQTHGKTVNMDNAMTSAGKDGSELGLLGPTDPIELADSPGMERMVSTTSYTHHVV